MAPSRGGLVSWSLPPAIAPPRDDEFEALDLYHATAGGEAALARMHRDDAIRKSAHARAVG
jgi:hypothetical protein